MRMTCELTYLNCKVILNSPGRRGFGTIMTGEDHLLWGFHLRQPLLTSISIWFLTNFVCSGEYLRALERLGTASVLSVTAKGVTFAGPSLLKVILYTSLNSNIKDFNFLNCSESKFRLAFETISMSAASNASSSSFSRVQFHCLPSLQFFRISLWGLLGLTLRYVERSFLLASLSLQIDICPVFTVFHSGSIPSVFRVSSPIGIWSMSSSWTNALKFISRTDATMVCYSMFRWTQPFDSLVRLSNARSYVIGSFRGFSSRTFPLASNFMSSFLGTIVVKATKSKV